MQVTKVKNTHDLILGQVPPFDPFFFGLGVEDEDTGGVDRKRFGVGWGSEGNAAGDDVFDRTHVEFEAAEQAELGAGASAFEEFGVATDAVSVGGLDGDPARVQLALWVCLVNA